jgi:hypothetical protein
MLTSLTAADSSGNMDLGVTADVKQVTYLYSIRYQCQDFCNSPIGIVAYAIPAGMHTFSAVIGVPDDTPSASEVGTFEVHFDGSTVPAKTWRATLGHPVHVAVPVRGHSQLELVAARSGTVTGVMAGSNAAAGVSNNLPDLVWGNPLLKP